MPKAAPKKHFDADGFGLAPVEINDTAWLYEEKKGVTVVQEERDRNGKHVTTVQTLIPWSTLCDAVDRFRNAKRRE